MFYNIFGQILLHSPLFLWFSCACFLCCFFSCSRFSGSFSFAFWIRFRPFQHIFIAYFFYVSAFWYFNVLLTKANNRSPSSVFDLSIWIFGEYPNNLLFIFL